MSTMHTPSPEEQWTMPPQPPPGATAPPPSARPPTGPARFRGPATTVAVVLAGLLVGGGVMYALDHRAGAAAGTGAPSAVAVPGPNRLGGGVAPGGAGTPGGAGGPLAGERLQGTVTAKTATTVTVKSSAGTATYTVDASSQIVRDGQAATLAAVQVGDPVFLHVYPSSSGRLMAERLFAGSSASDAGPGGLGSPGLTPPGATPGGAVPPAGPAPPAAA